MGTGISKINSYNIELWIFAICLVLSIPPYFLWQLSSPYFVIGCLLIAAKHAKLSDRTANDMFFMFLLTGIYFFYGFLNSTSLQGTLYVCLIPILFYADRKFLTDAFEKFVYVFSITLAFSIIQFILVQILGISMPAKSIQPLNKAKQASYLAYTFYVTTNQCGADILPRFFGYYDEPGVVGTLSGLILMTRKFNLKKLINIPIFIGGLLSFSLFFYVIAIAYTLIFVLSTKIKYMVLTLIFCGILYGFYHKYYQDNEAINRYIISRMEYENGNFSGNNRTHGGMDAWYKTYFENSDDYYFGLGAGASQIYNPGGASYKDIIINCGIVFFAAYMGIFTLFGFYNLKFSKEFLLYLIMLYGTIFQRPFIDSFVYIFLLYIPVIYLINNQKRESISN